MKNYILICMATFTIIFSSCSNGQTLSKETNLSATEFDAKIKELSSAPIVDVRTPEEFAKGHLQNAKNINWNGDDFEKQIATLDKTKPVFVYCLSGGRSSAAASQMRGEGFREVYELKGGIMKWRGANLPETTDNVVRSVGMSKKQFDDLLRTDKTVLIDFYADWCAPCKKMKPYLEEISKDMSDQVVVIRINADDNQNICKELKIDALPVLQVYKKQSLFWSNSGYISKEDVVKQLK